MLVSPAQLGQLTRFLSQHEISEDPHGVIVTAPLHLTSGITGRAILKHELSAYPRMVAFLAVLAASCSLLSAGGDTSTTVAPT